MAKWSRRSIPSASESGTVIVSDVLPVPKKQATRFRGPAAEQLPPPPLRLSAFKEFRPGRRCATVDG